VTQAGITPPCGGNIDRSTAVLHPASSLQSWTKRWPFSVEPLPDYSCDYLRSDDEKCQASLEPDRQFDRRDISKGSFTIDFNFILLDQFQKFFV
jgi:hypothetical protein